MYRPQRGTLLVPPARRTLHDVLQRRVETEEKGRKRQRLFLMCVAKHNNEGVSLVRAYQELHWSRETAADVQSILILNGLTKIAKGSSKKGQFPPKKIHLTHKGKRFLEESLGGESTLTQKTSV